MESVVRNPQSSIQLYRLTIQCEDGTFNVYSSAASVETAFKRYLERVERRKESMAGISLVHGELANPHAPLGL